MFFRASTLLFSVAALSSFVVAAPGVLTARGGDDSCLNRVMQCCMNTYKSSEVNAQTFGISAPIVGPLVATQCTTFTAVGVASGSNCNQQAVCCSQTNLGGKAVSMGCMPVNIGM